ncbi:hypothetical protein E4U14_000265, partial [Claviceps sp. LM454 group G7]
IAASPTLRQSGPILPAQCGLDPDDVFGPTSAQSREFFAPSARSGQYRSTTVSDESEVETDIITPSAALANIDQQQSLASQKSRPTSSRPLPALANIAQQQSLTSQRSRPISSRPLPPLPTLANTARQQYLTSQSNLATLQIRHAPR